MQQVCCQASLSVIIPVKSGRWPNSGPALSSHRPCSLIRRPFPVVLDIPISHTESKEWESKVSLLWLTNKLIIIGSCCYLSVDAALHWLVTPNCILVGVHSDSLPPLPIVFLKSESRPNREIFQLVSKMPTKQVISINVWTTSHHLETCVRNLWKRTKVLAG